MPKHKIVHFRSPTRALDLCQVATTKPHSVYVPPQSVKPHDKGWGIGAGDRIEDFWQLLRFRLIRLHNLIIELLFPHQPQAPDNSHRHSYLCQPRLQILQLALLDDQMAVIIQIFDDVVVSFFVVFEDDGFHGRIALDEDSCLRLG